MKLKIEHLGGELEIEATKDRLETVLFNGTRISRLYRDLETGLQRILTENRVGLIVRLDGIEYSYYKCHKLTSYQYRCIYYAGKYKLLAFKDDKLIATEGGDLSELLEKASLKKGDAVRLTDSGVCIKAGTLVEVLKTGPELSTIQYENEHITFVTVVTNDRLIK